MSAESVPYLQLTIDAPEQDALMIAAALESFAAPVPQSVSVRRMGRSAPWRVEAIFEEAPDARALAEFLGEIAPDTEHRVTPLADEDWVALSQSKLAPIRTQRFYIRNYQGALPEDLGARHVISIEAGLAFGTGHHASTHGCLLMLDRLPGNLPKPRRVLDLGAGTAVLAIAAHKLWPAARIVASDIDPVAVAVGQDNCRLNGAPGVACMVAPGFRHPRQVAPFDLVFANILAGPLKSLARDAARHISPNGLIMLSGLLDEQAGSVMACYRAAGFCLLKRRDLEGWSTLLMQRAGYQGAS